MDEMHRGRMFSPLRRLSLQTNSDPKKCRSVGEFRVKQRSYTQHSQCFEMTLPIYLLIGDSNSSNGPTRLDFMRCGGRLKEKTLERDGERFGTRSVQLNNIADDGEGKKVTMASEQRRGKSLRPI